MTPRSERSQALDRFAVPDRVFSFELLCLAAFLCFIPPTQIFFGSPGAVLFTVGGAVALIGAAVARPWLPDELSAARTATGIGGLVVVALLLSAHTASALSALFADFTVEFALIVAVASLSAAAVGILVFFTPLTRLHRWLATGVIIAALVLIGFVYIELITEVTIDVFVFHREGAAALLRGENPYVVVVGPETTNPLVPGTFVFEGYPYPPIALYAYSLGQWFFGDPRWTSVAAIAVVVGLIALPQRTADIAVVRSRLGLATLFSAPPAFGVITYFAWIEPLSLPFLLVAGRYWKAKPVVSAVALGLALATKQYFALVLPLVLLWPDEFRWKRVGIAGVTAVATALPFLIANPTALWDAAVAAHLVTATQPQTVVLANIGLVTPAWLAAAASLGLAAWLGHRGGEGYRFLVGMAGVLGVAFILGPRAFPNYWFELASIALIALALRFDGIAVASESPLRATPSLG